MKNTAAAFTPEELFYIRQYGGAMLRNDVDYSRDDMRDIRMNLKDNFPYYDSEIFDSIMRKLLRHFGVG